MRICKYMNIQTLNTNTIQVYKYTLKPHAEFATAETNAYTQILDTKNPHTIIHIDEYIHIRTYTDLHRYEYTSIYIQTQTYTSTNRQMYKDTQIHIYTYRTIPSDY